VSELVLVDYLVGLLVGALLGVADEFAEANVKTRPPKYKPTLVRERIFFHKVTISAASDYSSSAQQKGGPNHYFLPLLAILHRLI
jgi:hypothetical protein